jgi:hypothetical protein
MSRGSKFSVFLSWVDPSSSSKTNGDKQLLLSPNDGDASEERKANIKRAWFFATVAVLFVLANQLGHVRNASDSNSGPASAASVSLTLSHLEGPRERVGFSVRFRLSNRGKHSIFSPMRTGTNAPLGQIIARTSPSSEWISLSTTSKQQVSPVSGFMDANLTWIEMPPGGWVDGEFHDANESSEEHAYVIYVKPARDASAIRIVSNSYPSLANQ